jgi:YVTN family beta-propeller protein
VEAVTGDWKAPTVATERRRTGQLPTSGSAARPLPTAKLHHRVRSVPTPHRFPLLSRSLAASSFLLLLVTFGCHRSRFPDVPDGYREYAYISNGKSNTVTVLDLVYLRQDRTLQVGTNPSALAVNPVRNEVYVVNTGSGSVSVINAESNRVVATIPVHRLPRSIAVDATGRRAYVANSGSNTVSILNLDRLREIGTAGTGEQPGLVRISPDGRTLVVTNAGSGSVSIFNIAPSEPPTPRPAPPLHLRAAFPDCPGASDAAILPDSSKAFIACSDGHQV